MDTQAPQDHELDVDWHEGLRTTASIFAALGSVTTAVLFGIVIYQGTIQIDQLRRDRNVRTVHDVLRGWDTERITEARYTTNRWLTNNPSTPVAEAPEDVLISLQTVVNYLERLGYMVDREMIEVEHVDALMSPLIASYWCIYQEPLKDLGPRHGEWFRSFAEGWMERRDTNCKELP